MAQLVWDTAKQWIHSVYGESTTYGFYVDSETQRDFLLELDRSGKLGKEKLGEKKEILLVGTKEHCKGIKFPTSIRKGVKDGTTVVYRQTIEACIRTRLEKQRKWFAQSLSHEDELTVEYLIKRGLDNDPMPNDVNEDSVPYVRPGDDVWKIEQTKLPENLRYFVGREYRQGELKANSNSKSWDEVKDVRGWRFPPLENTYFIAADERDIRRSLQIHIQKTLRTAILVSNGGFGGPGKYQHFHATACFTGKDFRKGNLFLELWGELLSVGNKMRNDLEFSQLFCDEYGQKRFRPHTYLQDQLVFGIRVCSLANITYPGVRVPGYM